MKKIENIEELISLFENAGYYGTEDIIMEAYLGLANFGGKIKPGQDIRAVCLDGPPGSGKTSFVENYVEIYKELSGEEVEFINYECNDTTGKSDLYEEINISSAIKRDADKVLIEGCLTEAIRKVNEGKKVILLLDEFDKSRTETDVFFFKFLQSGEINTTQHGILRVKDEYKTNLQVFFCKNDLRELSGPLMRRTRSVKLECMTPARFNDVARSRLLIENNINEFLESLITLVTLIYEFAYNNQARFERIPSCSEMMIAICDAYDISTELKTTSKQTYNIILKRMFKNEDDYETFLGLLKASKKEDDKVLKDFLSELQKSEEVISVSLREKIANDLIKSDERIQRKLQEIEAQFAAFEERINSKITKEYPVGEKSEIKISKEKQTQGVTSNSPSNINLTGGKLVLNTEDIKYDSLFEEGELIKRGIDVFSTFTDKESHKIVSAKFTGVDHFKIIDSLVNEAKNLGIKIYENGILLIDKDIKLIMVASIDSKNNPTYEFHVNSLVCPSTELQTIYSCCKYMDALLKTMGIVSSISINIDGLLYNDISLEDSAFDIAFGDNVYHVSRSNMTLEDFGSFVNRDIFKCDNYNKIFSVCDEMKKTLKK